MLFFQKGKFYELYENDAQIGHSVFDLKLTDRVSLPLSVLLDPRISDVALIGSASRSR